MTTTAIALLAMTVYAPAHAATITTTGDGTWASAGGATGANLANAAANDTLFINGAHNVMFEPGSANDGQGNFTFTVGDVTDSGVIASKLTFNASSGSPFTLNTGSITDINQINILSLGGVGMTVNTTGNISVVDYGITGNRTNPTAMVHNISGNLSVTNGFGINNLDSGPIRIAVGGNITTPSASLGGATGQAILELNGAAAQSVTGQILGGALGQGRVVVSNSSAGGVTFNSLIGNNGAQNINSIVVGNGATDVRANFKTSVFTTAGVTLGDGGGTKQTSTIYITVAAGGRFQGGVNGDGVDDANIVFEGGAAGNYNFVGTSGGVNPLNNVQLNNTGTALTFLGTVTAKTITGGAGSQTILVSGGTTTLNADISGIENFVVAGSQLLRLTGGVAGGNIEMQGITGLNQKLLLESAGKIISSSINITAPGGEATTIELTGGTLTGNITGGASNDTLLFKGGTFTGSANFGAGNDAITLTGADAAISGAITGLETINMTGRKLTVSAGIAGLTTDINVGAGGELSFGAGGSVDRAVNGNDGTVSYTGGTHNLSYGIRDAILNIAGGTVKTNGQALGAGGAANALHNVTIGSNGVFVVQDAVTSGGILRVDGELQVANGKTLAVAGYNAASTGTIMFDVAGGGTLTGGLIDMGGAALNLSGATLKINVTTDPETLTKGQIVTLAQNAGAITLPTAALVDNSTRYNFTLTAQGGNLVLGVEQVSIGGQTPNTNAAAAVIANLPGNDPLVAAVQSRLFATASSDTREKILESLAPTLDTGHMQAALSVMGASFEAIDQRIAGLKDMSGLSAGDPASRERRIWAQGFGEIAHQGERGGIAGYDAATTGAAIGIDRSLFDGRGLIGIAFSYADTGIDSRNANSTDTDVSSYQLTAYGDYDLSDLYYVRGMGALSRHDVSQVRHDVGGVSGTNAKADFDAVQFTLKGQLGQNLKAWRGMTLSPHILSNYSHYQADGYTESGAGGLNQSVRHDAVQMFEIGGGLGIRKTFTAANGDRIEPSLNTSYRYDLAGQNLRMSSSFAAGGNAYIVNAPAAARGTFTVGTGLKIEGHSGLSFAADYEFETRADFLSHAATMRIGKRF